MKTRLIETREIEKKKDNARRRQTVELKKMKFNTMYQPPVKYTRFPHPYNQHMNFWNKQLSFNEAYF